MMPDQFDSVEHDDILEIVMHDGAVLTGAYIGRAGMHFLHVRDGTPIGRVVGPLPPNEIQSATVVRTRQDILSERRERKLGDPVPGSLTRTRDGYEARLQTLANVAARTDGYLRQKQVEAQFDEVADEIRLAKTKRNWMLAVARWSLHSNQVPTKLDLCGGDLYSAERVQRPRPQDFDPDPKARRARPRLPHHIANDPMRALRCAGFTVRISMIGEVTHDRADLLVKHSIGTGRDLARWEVEGYRNHDGAMKWQHRWYGNGSRACLRRRLRTYGTTLPDKLKMVLTTGLRTIRTS